LHKQDKKVNIYYSTIIDDNLLAKKILTSQRDYLPTYSDIGKLNTFVITFLKKKEIKQTLNIVRGRKELINDIVNFMHKNGKDKQFYPYYTTSDFETDYLMGFKVTNFYIAYKNEEIVGIVGVWNQEFKQTIITNYSLPIKFLRHLFDMTDFLGGMFLLPNIGDKINHFYLGFITIKDNDVNIFNELLGTIYNEYINTSYSYFIVGLHENDNLTQAMNEYQHTTYHSRLYCVYWEDGKEDYAKLDKRTPYVEVATL